MATEVVTVENKAVVEAFLKSLKTEQTRRTYEQAFKVVFEGKPEEFLSLSVEDRRKGENFLLDFIALAREKYSGSSTRTYLAATKALIDFAEIQINWKKISKAAPRISKSEDRPPNPDEIRGVFDPGDNRFKFIISAMVSGGFRVGSWDYLKIKDFKIIEVLDQASKLNPHKVQIGQLKIYSGEPESYDCFVSTECVKYYQIYLDERRRSGEVITPNSPIIVHPINYQSKIKGMRTKRPSIVSQLQYAWIRAGFKDREFKNCHGFRKYFKTQLESSGMKSIVVERLLGHDQGLDSNYYRPTIEQLASEYVKYQHCLFLDLSIALKNENEELVNQARSEIAGQAGEIQVLKSKVSTLTDALNTVMDILKRIEVERKNEKDRETAS